MKKRTGWVIATVATAVLVAGGAVLYELRRHTLGEPSAVIKTHMSLIQFKPDLSSLMTIPGDRGAEGFYDHAVERAVALGKVVDFPTKMIKSLEPENDPELQPILEDLISAAQAGIGDDVMLNFPELPVDGPQEAKVTQFMTSLATLPSEAAYSMAHDKKWASATEIADAGLLFSYRLWSHGGTWSNRQAGLVGMDKALSELKSIYAANGNAEKGEAVNRIERERAAAANLWDTKATLTFQHSPFKLHPADLLYMATHDEDRTWRLEGLKWLGVARYSGATEQDRAVINRDLEELETSGDEAIADAARRARELTLDEVHRMLP